MISKQLNSDDVLKTLAQNRQAIRNLGVSSLALFGSVAVDRATADSDLNFLVEFEGTSTFDRYMDLKFFLEDLFNVPIDLVTKRSLKKKLVRRSYKKRFMSRDQRLYLSDILNDFTIDE